MPLFVTVTPGTTVTNSTTLDATTLNLLGTPAIDVTGTVDGGSLSLSPGSVGTTQLADDSVTFAKFQNISTDRLLGRDTAGTGDVEQLTVGGGLQFTGTGGIEVANAGITYAKIQNTANGSRLIGRAAATGGTVGEIEVGSGLSLSVGGVLSASKIVTTYSSPSGVAIPAAAGQVAGFNHSLGGYPSSYVVFAQCVNVSGSNGFANGDRVLIDSIQGDSDVPAFVAWATNAQLGLRRTNQANLYLNNKSTGARAIISSSDWQLYFEAVRFS